MGAAGAMGACPIPTPPPPSLALSLSLDPNRAARRRPRFSARCRLCKTEGQTPDSATSAAAAEEISSIGPARRSRRGRQQSSLRCDSDMLRRLKHPAA